MDALVLRSQHQTIVITRSLVPARAAQMRQTSGGELRGALDAHLSGDSVDTQLLSTFWLAAGGPVLSVLRSAELVAAVVAAVEAGRLRAYVFKEPAYISQASHQALRGEADRAARSPTRPGSPATGRQLNVAQMGVAERFVEVFHRTVPRVGPELGRQLRTLVENPADLAFMVGTVVILVQLHAVAAGEVIDGIVLTAIIACAVIEGMGVFQATLSALEAAANLVDFLTTTLAARDDKDLDRAAEKLAAGLSAVGVGILSAALARIAGRFTDSLKKAGGQRKVETVSREEMAGKGRGAPATQADPGPPKSSSATGGSNTPSAGPEKGVAKGIGGRVPCEAGKIVNFVQPEEQVYYRVYTKNQTGSFLTAVPPRNAAYAREALALPSENKATYIQEVRVPAGTSLRRSRAKAAFGKRGGGEQFELLNRIPESCFGPGRPLS
ncbi:hypothetical protein J5J86_03540 [Aquabacter sp. L1I39]|uniref:hypothetical protein n=1 Tax=Aquabacter sp. L1I39 TaxID=2820278 RepID=UPI001AD9841D|nr:hypothetical protein [Aquabacter sp. L1I39]QTL04428.1 hypothetical protein J5J86_03540 [Aquabacter sp. L1I39]